MGSWLGSEKLRPIQGHAAVATYRLSGRGMTTTEPLAPASMTTRMYKMVAKKKAPSWLAQGAPLKVIPSGALGLQRSLRLQKKDAAIVDQSYEPKLVTILDDDSNEFAEIVHLLL